MSENDDKLIPASTARESDELIEITTHIRPDQALGLEIIQTAEQQRRGVPVDRGELIRRAIDMLVNSQVFAIRLREGRKTLNSGREKKD